MRSQTSRVLGTSLTVGILFLAGCGRVPTAPMLEPTDAVATAADANSTSISPDRQDPGLSTENPVLAPPESAGTQSLQASAQIHGQSGGDLVLGNVALHVPAGAFNGNATITMTLPDPNGTECALSVTPASKNRFSIPATITFNAAAIADVRAMVVYEFDADQGMWVQLPCAVESTGKTLAANIGHGAKYKADTEAVRRSAR